MARNVNSGQKKNAVFSYNLCSVPFLGRHLPFTIMAALIFCLIALQLRWCNAFGTAVVSLLKKSISLEAELHLSKRKPRHLYPWSFKIMIALDLFSRSVRRDVRERAQEVGLRGILRSGLREGFSSCVFDSLWVTTDGPTVTHRQSDVVLLQLHSKHTLSHRHSNERISLLCFLLSINFWRWVTCWSILTNCRRSHQGKTNKLTKPNHICVNIEILPNQYSEKAKIFTSIYVVGASECDN